MQCCAGEGGAGGRKGRSLVQLCHHTLHIVTTKGPKKDFSHAQQKKKKTLTTENTHAHLELILNEASLSCIHSFTRRRAKTDHEGRPHRCSSPARSPTTSGQFNIPKGAQSVVRARRYQQPCEQTDRQIQTLNMTELVVI